MDSISANLAQQDGTKRALSTLRIYGNDAYQAKFRRSRPIDAPRARYTGFKNETITLKSGTIRREGALALTCDILFERDVAVTLRDGTTIYADIFRPTGNKKVPAIIAWSPYGKQIGGMSLDDVLHRVGVPLSASSGLEKFQGPDPAYWVAQGYAILHPDTRGAYASEGNVTFWGRQLAEDGYDFIEWAAQQPWSSGKLALSGNSWLAVSQWYITAERPPHLAAIAPWEGLADPFRDMVNRGGIPNFAFTEAVIATCMAGNTFVEDMPRMAIDHPTIDEYWEDKVARLDHISVPAYVVSSYSNPIHTRSTLAGFRSIRSKDKWLRIHNTFECPDYYNLENVEDLRKFFDYYLKGDKNDWQATPRVRLSVLDPEHADTVNRPVEEWPVLGYPAEKFYLHADHTLSNEHRTTSNTLSYETGTENSRITFSHTFEKKTEVVGYMNLRLWVEAVGSDDMDLLAYAEKRDKDGNVLPNATGGVPSTVSAAGLLRVSHRALDPKLSTELEPRLTHKKEELLSPGQIVWVEIGLWPTALRFHPGEQLVLTVQAAPKAAANVDMGFGVSMIPVPARGGTFKPGDKVEIVELGGGIDSQPEFVNAQRVETPPSRNKGTHVFHLGGEYESVLLVPLAEAS
ncbi:unnamed protein product [Clonostachys rosea f. rosea IK726]|uniref:Uncharacterized protein n=1 Tax=Clonostachys rosea f. rosea IK726 TaxID=1349383 RepID=A0ACA9TVR9_BIOOC|nr:unnamed protein product [Clonostachys rosea f. rosea IK726]